MLKGSAEFLLGNEAIAKGAIQGQVAYITGYPGTPSSEIIGSLLIGSGDGEPKIEWATNEMVAFGNAMGASLAGKRSMVTMKHAGMNWVSDPLSVAVLSGVRAGVAIIAADDPNCHSSANEQDSRFYGQFFGVPVLEPSDPQEAMEMASEAFDISEETGLPVILRSVTRVSHCRANVTLFQKARKPSLDAIDPDSNDYYITGPKAIAGCHALHEKQKTMAALLQSHKFNRWEQADKGAKVIVTSGVAYTYTKDAMLRLGVETDIVKLGIINPLPQAFLGKALKGKKEILVIEEGAPLLETKIKALLSDLELQARVRGKSTGHLSSVGELNVDLVVPAIAEFLGGRQPAQKTKDTADIVTDKAELTRSMLFCAGCPHTGTMYCLKRTMKKLKIHPFIGGDIGCYTLMTFPPFQLGTSKFNMGSSISVASGYSRMTGQKAVAVIGDSTYIHAGIPALINAVYNKANLLLVICDNRTTAMTGGQQNAATGLTAAGDQTFALNLADLSAVLGADKVKVVDPYDLKATTKAFEESLSAGWGVEVIVSRRECALIAARHNKNKPFTVDPELCVGCKKCMRSLACSALEFKDGKTFISSGQCTGCSVCAQVCPNEAISRQIN
jgi:indolepyruvate ferredoxin oxidoreductase alpha subunit